MLKTFAVTCLIAVVNGVERKTIPFELYEIADDIKDEHDHHSHKHHYEKRPLGYDYKPK